MTLTTDTPAVAPPSSSTRPRRRWRRVGLVVGLVVGATLVAGWAAAPRLVLLRSSGAPSFAGAPVVSLPTFGENGTYALTYEHQAAVTLEVSVSNDGVLPMTISSARFTDEPLPLVETTEVTAGDNELPVTIDPGDSVALRLAARFDNCRYYHEREAQILAGVVVEGSVVGRDFSREVELDQQLVVRSPMIVGCPDRTLTRDDDVRR